jgi:Skp family chaperone for outer membrane proteins
VKVTWALVASAACMLQLFIGAMPLFGQTGGAAAARPIAPVAARPSGTNVAVIDVGQIFDKHPQFQAQMMGLKKQVEDLDAFMRNEQKRMLQMRDDLQAFTPGSPQYKAKEEEMARLQSDLNVKMALQRKEFVEKEARVYFETYNEVYEIVASVADRNGIGLVLRFNSEDMKAEDRGSVLNGVNRAVVFQRNLNITKMVVDEVQRRYPQQVSNAAAAPGTKALPR